MLVPDKTNRHGPRAGDSQISQGWRSLAQRSDDGDAQCDPRATDSLCLRGKRMAWPRTFRFCERMVGSSNTPFETTTAAARSRSSERGRHMSGSDRRRESGTMPSGAREQPQIIAITGSDGRHTRCRCHRGADQQTSYGGQAQRYEGTGQEQTRSRPRQAVVLFAVAPTFTRSAVRLGSFRFSSAPHRGGRSLVEASRNAITIASALTDT